MKNLFTLKKYFLKYKSKLLWGFLFILISNAGVVYIPILLKESINQLQNSISKEKLLEYSLLIILTSLIAGIFRFLIRQTIIVVSREIEFDLRRDFWNHVQKLPFRFFQNNSTGNIMAHATNDINAVRSFVGPAVMYSIDTGIRIMIVVIIMISIDWSLTLFALLPLPFLSIAVYKIMKLIHEKYIRIQEKFSELTSKAQENFAGIRIIKSFVREESEIQQWKNLSKDYLKMNMSLVKVQALIMPILLIITGLSIIIVIWIGGIKIINQQISLGEVTAFIVYLGILIWPVIAFGWVTNLIQQAEASMKRLNKIFKEPYEIIDLKNSSFDKKSIEGYIEFRNVYFRYNDNLPYVLKNINLKIEKGSTIAIIGPTGSGKTSLINLIPRLYDVCEGEIIIDSFNVKEIPLEILRKNIGLVPQESFLFSDSIAKNISYGLREISMEIVSNVSKISQLEKDIESFPDKYETIVGERGITLSGGQKQRVSIARALAINPKILILDDSFSSVDTNTEEEILKNLSLFMKGRTSIIISHRISTVKNADKIIFLKDGEIVEEGTHEQLLALNGHYADLHFKQLLEKELEEIG
jgi:ATP-binding cassette subfamily B protein